MLSVRICVFLFLGSIRGSPIPSHLANMSAASAHNIASPLRMLTITSPGPVTPLRDLMQSPQVAQKVYIIRLRLCYT